MQCLEYFSTEFYILSINAIHLTSILKNQEIIKHYIVKNSLELLSTRTKLVVILSCAY